MKYKSKPVVIEAIQWNGDNLQEVMEFIGSEFKYDKDINYFTSKFNYCSASGLQLYALGGLMSVSINDYIGVKGEFYPCKPDIFQATYEVLDNE